MRKRAPRTQKERTEETRARLLDAAREIFLRSGFEAASIDEIARKAGYTRGAFYFNFKSKDELFIALLQRDVIGVMGEVRDIERRFDDPRERLRALIELYARLGPESGFALLLLEYKLYAIRHPRSHAKMAAAALRLRQSREKVLDRIVEALEIETPVRVELIERGLWALCSGLALEHRFMKHTSAPELRRILTVFFERVVGMENDTAVKHTLLRASQNVRHRA